MKTIWIKVRVSEEERKTLQSNAASANLSVSDFIRSSCISQSTVATQSPKQPKNVATITPKPTTVAPTQQPTVATKTRFCPYTNRQIPI